jgi:hypothetical protein
MQDGHTSHFIFQAPRVLAYISEFMTLEPGDIVLTGTPAGVGLGHKPVPRFLQDGDVMRLGGQGLGEQRIHCRAWVRRTPKAAEAAVRKHGSERADRWRAAKNQGAVAGRRRQMACQRGMHIGMCCLGMASSS